MPITTLPQMMTLQSEQPQRLAFRFDSSKWAIGLLLAAAVFVAAFGLIWFSHPLSRTAFLIITGLFTSIFLYSGLYSLTAAQTLDIDGAARQVSYFEKTLYRTLKQTKSFEEFTRLDLMNPDLAGEGMARSWRLRLTASDGSIYWFSQGGLGFRSEQEAQTFAAKVTALMGLSPSLV